MRLSLRGRGLVALFAAIVFLGVLALAIDRERQELLRIANELEALHQKEAALNKVAHAINHSLLRTQALVLGESPGSSAGDDVALDLELIQAGLVGVKKYFPEFEHDVARLAHIAQKARSHPSKAWLQAINGTERILDERLSAIDTAMIQERGKLWQSYHDSHEKMTVVGVTLNVVGFVLLGAVVTLFFSRLAWDIGKVKERALLIVRGYRGAALQITRADEVGDLMAAVNRMQTELREREQQVEDARALHCHREKMAALGSLASGLAHEINNPIAAIAGVAQALVAAEGAGRGAGSLSVADGARLILEQTQRISTMSRQVGEFTRQRTLAPELIDLNALVRSTCNFTRYDRRMRNVELVLTLDDDLPALLAVADHLTQVLMNLLFNAADAFAGESERKPVIHIATSRAPGEVVLTVTDNGHGMDAATLARAFEESFSTKSADAGRGLGLSLSKSLIERGGGRIILESAPSAGTTATVRIPLEASA